MLHLSWIFESTISAYQSILNEIEPPEISSISSLLHCQLANSAEFMENAKTSGIFEATNRIYSSNVNAVDHIDV